MAQSILICDDDEGILEVSRAVLESSGYEVHTLSSFDNFFSILDQEKPDLLLVDLWMPKIGGEQMIRKLRKNKKTSNLPIVIISASKDIGQICKESGANGYLGKPFDIDDLLSLVGKIIN
jgi:DNA-binding response OmpR family regulator